MYNIKAHPTMVYHFQGELTLTAQAVHTVKTRERIEVLPQLNSKIII